MKMARDAQSAPYDFTPLKAPGLKVMHVQDLDYRSNCPTFVGCLKEIRAWSQAHPDHVPILVIMNLKEGGAGFPARPRPWPSTPRPWTVSTPRFARSSPIAP
uniref:Uncharacterized protein n=1 Tax=Phenylobacterium glaciei TaxID=2803784 RepID=A0A974P634_9CAUL|nr:hypothetical protein JKL49_10465 [Phenylobacterium glaciei]